MLRVRAVADCLLRDVDELVLRVVRRERADRLVVALLVGDLAAQRAGRRPGCCRARPSSPAFCPLGASCRGLHEQLPLAVAVDHHRHTGRSVGGRLALARRWSGPLAGVVAAGGAAAVVVVAGEDADRPQRARRAAARAAATPAPRSAVGASRGRAVETVRAGRRRSRPRPRAAAAAAGAGRAARLGRARPRGSRARSRSRTAARASRAASAPSCERPRSGAGGPSWPWPRARTAGRARSRRAVRASRPPRRARSRGRARPARRAPARARAARACRACPRAPGRSCPAGGRARRSPAFRASAGRRWPCGANCSVPARMDSPVRTYPAPGTLDDVLGFEMLEASPERCRGRFNGREARAAAARPRARRRVRRAGGVDGLGHHPPGRGGRRQLRGRPVEPARTSCARPPRASSTRRARRSTAAGPAGSGTFSFTDDDGRLCAASRVTLAVRPAEAP